MTEIIDVIDDDMVINVVVARPLRLTWAQVSALSWMQVEQLPWGRF